LKVDILYHSFTIDYGKTTMRAAPSSAVLRCLCLGLEWVALLYTTSPHRND
jgi:hypothetical protein